MVSKRLPRKGVRPNRTLRSTVDGSQLATGRAAYPPPPRPESDESTSVDRYQVSHRDGPGNARP
jgi:hypothetical protein